MQTIRGVLAIVLLIHLLVLAEGAKRTCPKIGNITTNVNLIFSDREELQGVVYLSAFFTTTDRSACVCTLHEVIRGRLRLKARMNNCFRDFVVAVNVAMHRISIQCKKRRCPKVIETKDVDPKFMDCDQPEGIENGNVTYKTTFAGSTATYSCKDGYQLDPPDATRRSCDGLGTWFGEIPTCVGLPVDCGPPPQIKNGTVIGQAFTSMGSVAAYYCSPGTIRVGNNPIVCQDDGTWGDPPMCVLPAGCGPPPQISFGSAISGTVTPVGGAAFYLCDIDATLVGNDTIFCQDNGTWEEPPMCIPPVDCGPPPQITNATVVGGFFTSVGSVVGYSCDFPTNLVGNDTIYCQDDGTWEDPPICVPPKDCGPPPQIANGSAELLRSGGLSAALYSCDFGYTLVGDGIGTCYANGTWSELPVCKQIQ